MLRFRKPYRKKLEKEFSSEPQRRGFNFPCDPRLSVQVRMLAAALECPIYPLAEHLLELGIQEVAEIVADEAVRENLQRHLLQQHLLVKELRPEATALSRRVLRIRNALKFLELHEKLGVPLQEIGQALDVLQAKARGKRGRKGPGGDV